jgi:hypothetical protein
MRRTQWKRFEDLIAKADCRAAVLRLCSSVPLTVHDHVGFECPTHGKECTQNGSVALLWDMASGAVTEPILVGAKQVRPPAFTHPDLFLSFSQSH